MEKSGIGIIDEIPISQTNLSSANRCRRGPLRSRTVDTLLHILTLCNADSSIIIQNYSDKGDTHIGSFTNDIIANDSQCQKEMSMDETQVVLNTQEGGLNNKLVESTKHDHNISGERKDLSHKIDTNPSITTDIENQDKYDIVWSTLRTEGQSIPETLVSVKDVEEDGTQVVLDTQEGGLNNKLAESTKHDHNISGERKDLSHKIDTNPSITIDIKNQDKYDIVWSTLRTEGQSIPETPISDVDVEEGEISGEFLDLLTDDFMATEFGIENENENDLIPLSTEEIESVGKDMAEVVSITNRNLVDYSDVAVNGKSQESAKQANDSLPPQSILKNSGTKHQDPVYQDNGAQNNKKREGSCTEEERTNKKSKKSVDPITSCLENLTLLGEHPEGASQQVVASAIEDTANEKKKKRVLTKERKAKKKRKERIKRAEKNRKLGVKRLKLQPVIKEKKIYYCRHYLKGRCHEGENCKFSHDTIPLTKSKPCCHFARHSCMKGDDCPFDHQLSKYPCNNFLSTGFCSRGSDCMFSHEAQPSDISLNALNESNPEQNTPLNSGSKKQNNDVEKVDKKSCFVPKSVTNNTERNLVEITPKLSARPPKGINFLSQEKLPIEAHSSPKVDAEVKEITKTPLVIQDSKEISKTPPLIQYSRQITKKPPVIQDSKEITKMPPVIPRGINFLSFGKKPGLDNSNGGFSFKIGNGIGKSQLSNLEGEGSKSDSVVSGVKFDSQIVNNDKETNSTKKPVSMLPFVSSTSHRALQSTLAFASKFESGVKTSKPGNLSQKL